MSTPETSTMAAEMEMAGGPAPPAPAGPLAPPTEGLEGFRRALAGLADPSRAPGGAAEAGEIKATAVRLCSILAHLFGDELDRTTLWSRIASAVEAAAAKCDDGDLGRLASLCLEHVKADAGRAAACDALLQALETFEARPPEWRHAFVHYLARHRLAVVVHARARWERVKSKEIEL